MTTVAGDVAAAEALGTALQRAARGVASERDRLAAARAAALAQWSGDGADAFDAAVRRQELAAGGLGEAMAHTGRALVTFACDLRVAGQLAAAAARAADDGPTAANEVARLLAAARQAEREAHERLARGLRRVHAELSAAPRAEGGWDLKPPGPPDWVDLVNNLVLAPQAYASRAAQRADDAGELAKLLKGATRTGGVAERAAARAEWKSALRRYRELRDVAEVYDDLGRRVPVPAWLGVLDRPLSGTAPVLKRVPISAPMLVGFSTAVDIREGMSPELAVTKNVAATAAGMAAYAATGVVLGAAGVVGAPVILAAVGVGFVASWGVGQVVEHYGDDLADAAGAVADGVSDLAEGIGDAAGGAWRSVFG